MKRNRMSKSVNITSQPSYIIYIHLMEDDFVHVQLISVVW